MLRSLLKIKSQFPFFKNNPNIIYFDNAATSLKPTSVINAINEYYTKWSANIFRGESELTDKLLEIYFETKQKLANLFHITDLNEISFTSGTTMSLNIVSYLIEPLIKKGDVICTTYYEHSSSLLPTLELAKRSEAKVKFLDLDIENINLENILKQLKKIKNLKVVSLIQHSNIFGFTLPILDIGKFLASELKNKKIIFIVDGAQGATLHNFNISEANVSFYACSAHKMYGPTGIGMLYQNPIFNHLKPVIFGGHSVHKITKDLEIIYKKYPYASEPGTLNISAICGWNKALDFIQNLDKEAVFKSLCDLKDYAVKQLQKNIKDITIYFPKIRSELLFFNIKGYFCQDVANYLMLQKIITRAGDQCVKLLDNIQLEKAVRISFAIYNNKKEIDKLVQVLKQGMSEAFISEQLI